MDTAGLLWLRDLQRQLDHLRKARAVPNPFDTTDQDVAQLRSEVAALQVSVGVLLDVLVSKGVVSADELDGLFSAATGSAPETPPDNDPFGGLER